MAKEEPKIYSQEVKDAYKRMQDAYLDIEFDKITILTGGNGSGKSLIRKQIPFRLAEHLKLDEPQEAQRKMRSTSMDARTGSNPSMGALSGMMRDTEWVATSQDTLSNLQGLLNFEKNESDVQYILIDEYEIGCGEEVALALAFFINERLEDLMTNYNVKGALIITHSRIGVENIKADKFVNIEGLSKEEWLNRKIEPADLKKLDENELFSYIRDNAKKR